jgi:hypothetical protein
MILSPSLARDNPRFLPVISACEGNQPRMKFHFKCVTCNPEAIEDD